MKKLLSITLLIFVVILAACSQQSSNGDATNGSGDTNGDNSNSGEVKVMKLGSADPEVRPNPQGLYKFKEIVEEATNGSIEVQVFPASQLGGDREMFEGMQIGTVEGASMSTGPIAGFAPRVAVFDLPFIFPNKEAAYDVLDGPIGQEVLDELRSQGVVGLAYWENGVRHLTNNVKEVATLEDLKGLDIRVMESQIHIDLWSSLGANPTPMAWPEVFAALQQGVIDGQENPVGNVTANKLYEVQKYLTTSGHVYAANIFMVSERFWNTLTDEEKEIVQAAAEEARDYMRQLANEEDEKGFAEITEKGMTITHLSEEEADKFFEAVQPVYEKYSSSIGEDLVNRVVEAARP